VTANAGARRGKTTRIFTIVILLYSNKVSVSVINVNIMLLLNLVTALLLKTTMWVNAQRDGRPAEYRWRPLFNAAKFG